MNSRTYSLIVSVVFFSALGNVLLSKGMKQVGEIKNYSLSALLAVFVRTFTSGTIWTGILSFLIFFISYLMLVSWADFSYVQPVCAIGMRSLRCSVTFCLARSFRHCAGRASF